MKGIGFKGTREGRSEVPEREGKYQPESLQYRGGRWGGAKRTGRKGDAHRITKRKGCVKANTGDQKGGHGKRGVALGRGGGDVKPGKRERSRPQRGWEYQGKLEGKKDSIKKCIVIPSAVVGKIKGQIPCKGKQRAELARERCPTRDRARSGHRGLNLPLRGKLICKLSGGKKRGTKIGCQGETAGEKTKVGNPTPLKKTRLWLRKVFNGRNGKKIAPTNRGRETTKGSFHLVAGKKNLRNQSRGTRGGQSSSFQAFDRPRTPPGW